MTIKKILICTDAKYFPGIISESEQCVATQTVTSQTAKLLKDTLRTGEEKKNLVDQLSRAVILIIAVQN